MNRLILFSIVVLFASCKKEAPNRDYRQDMRDFVIGISTYAKSKQSGFIIIPQNGIELITEDGTETGNLNMPYLNAIDGHGQESFFFGYNNDDVATPSQEQQYLQAFLARSEQLGKVVLITDYCSTNWKMDSLHGQQYFLQASRRSLWYGILN